MKTELTAASLAKYFDQTLLKPYVSDADFKAFCEESARYHFKMIAINSAPVAKCKAYLKDSDVLVGAAIGFPLGQTTIADKVFETKQAIADGADEIDYVHNIVELKSGNLAYVEREMREIVEVCRENPEAMRAVNGADLVLPDGIGVVKGAAMLGTPLKEKTPGIEFAAGLMGKMAERGRSLYLLGAKPGVADMAAERLQKQYPGLKIAGTHDGYFKEDAPVVEAIRESGADCVFVCLGAPKQELWMARNGPATGAHLLCGLGGSLDVFAGTVERAPKFWSDHGLEWFYRLCKEPKRIGRMMKLPLFLVHVRQEKGKRK